MSVTAYTSPQTVDQSVKGATPWVNLSNVKIDDSVGATGPFVAGAESFVIRNAHLVIAGVIQTAVNKAANDATAGTWSKAYGGSADLWSAALTPAIVNNAEFGFAVAVGKNDGAGNYSDKSYYAIVKNFGFAIPSDATITGIEVTVEGNTYAGGGGTIGQSIDSILLRVNYTWPPKVRAVGYSSGSVYSALVQTREEPEKSYRYLVYDKDGNFLGDWRNRVANEPSFKKDINNLHSQMMIELAQNEKSIETAVTNLLTEEDEIILTEDDEELLVDIAASIGLGDGTDTEVNNEVEVIAFYGDFVELLTEEGEVMLTEDDELLLVEDGAPAGKKIFTGYIPEWELDFGETEDLQVQLLTHTQELNNIMLETSDTLKVSGATFVDQYIGIAGAGPDDNTRIAQTFTMVGTVPVNRIRLWARSGFAASDIPVTLTLTDGTTPGTPGTTLATASAIIKKNVDDSAAWQPIDFLFDQVTLTNGQTYEYFIDTDEQKTGGNSIYPAQFQTGAVYAGGVGYVFAGNPVGSWNALPSSADLVFQVYQPGGATEVTFNSMDPGNIFKAIIDFARTRGTRINYTPTSVELTGLTVSITFKTNTVAEALLAVLKLCPADWYTHVDYGDNIAHLHPRPTDPSRYYTKGRDTVKLKIKKSIIGIINDVYFSGAGTPALFRRKYEQTYIDDLRRGLGRLSDNRVSDPASAEILIDGEIDREHEAKYSGTIQVVRIADDRIEDITIGELSGFIGWGDIVDALGLQNMSQTYHPDYMDITLNKLSPKIQKRLEDLKRNLDALEQADNPTSPTVL